MSFNLSRLIIAEIGINHDGDLRTARKLIKDASKSGCYGIKFQYRNIERAYAAEINEIGDEILQYHISKAYLTPDALLSLRNYSKTLGLKVGISFFTTEDADDFLTDIDAFDFFKVPSVELLNEELIDKLLRLDKMVYLSTGMHKEEEVIGALERIVKYANWMPLHCISNYPLANHNVQLGQITHLKRWNHGVGYSSHDRYWENCIAALTLGALVIERHITYSKSADGLDHSSSSDFHEFVRICEYAKEVDLMLMGNGPRIPNQGEQLNRQNLGRSFYVTKDLDLGQCLSKEILEYRIPQIGLNYHQLGKLKGNKLLKSINKGQAITASHLLPVDQNLNSLESNFTVQHAISIPIRLRDHVIVREKLPTNHYEFHLSFGEIEKIEEYQIEILKSERYSVHLPDYISHNDLIDPWSEDESIRVRSTRVIEKTMRFSSELAKLTGQQVPVVASLSGLKFDKPNFFQSVLGLFTEYKREGAFMTLQWLPPIAWYFGGSIKLPHVNNLVDAKFIRDLNIPITLDSSHLILGSNFYEFNSLEVMDIVKDNIAHIHVSDASGIDGEGVQISSSSPNIEVIKKCLEFDVVKVMEVWQGHLDDYSGFKKAIREAYGMLKHD